MADRATSHTADLDGEIYRRGVAGENPISVLREQRDVLAARVEELEAELSLAAQQQESTNSYVEKLERRVQQLAEALRHADVQVSALHDALYERIPAGADRDVVNVEIWKLHDLLRAALAAAEPAGDTGEHVLRLHDINECRRLVLAYGMGQYTAAGDTDGGKGWTNAPPAVGAGGACGKHGLYDGYRCPKCAAGSGEAT